MTQTNNEREALISDAKEAGFINHPIHGLVVRHSNGSWISIAGKLEKFATLQLARAISQNELQEEVAYTDGEGDFITKEMYDEYLKLGFYTECIVPLYNSPPKQIPDGWISVKDRLPEKYTEVLVYPQPNEYTHCASYGKFKNKQIDDGWFYGEYKVGIGHENYTCKVTHWMPLPTAPTNTEEGE